MDKRYKAVPFQVQRHHAAVENEKEPWDDIPAYTTTERRYQIVDTETGEVLDDARGYGYRTEQKAYAAYAYNATRFRAKAGLYGRQVPECLGKGLSHAE